MPRKSNTVLVLHGGAGQRPLRGGRLRLHIGSLTKILNAVYPKLEKGMSAVEAVALAVQMLEDDPLYNAGKGSKIQSDGKIRMSASIMDGSLKRFGGCVNVEGVKNPVLLAKALMKRKDRVLSGLGAQKMARELNLKFASPYTDHQLRLWRAQTKGKSGTVGAVALDSRGKLAAATSTGGRGGEYPFRVSDSPTAAGNFANDLCAVSATGTGEQIVEMAAAATICAYVEAGLPMKNAGRRLLAKTRANNGEFGWIAVDHKGGYVASTTTPSITWAAASAKGFELPTY